MVMGFVCVSGGPGNGLLLGDIDINAIIQAAYMYYKAAFGEVYENAWLTVQILSTCFTFLSCPTINLNCRPSQSSMPVEPSFFSVLNTPSLRPSTYSS